MYHAICPSHNLFVRHNAKTNHIPPRVSGPTPRIIKTSATMAPIPEIRLSHGSVSMPLVGLGTASDPQATPEATKSAVLEAIKLGYRHFDTALKYQSEQPIGDAVREAVSGGLISSSDEICITSKLWVGDSHPELVAPALANTLRNLKMDCIDMYLVHWPVRSKPGNFDLPLPKEDYLPFDLAGVWAAMEECQKLGLVKAIGVSNFSCKKIGDILSIAKIPPAVNQVEVNPLWQQKKLIEFCKEKGVVVTAYSPLGAIGTYYGSNKVLESPILKDIAHAKGQTVPQVCLRWAYEQGIAVVVKSFNADRMKENIDIFNFELSREDHEKIRQIPQSKVVTGWHFISNKGSVKTLDHLWDGEI